MITQDQYQKSIVTKELQLTSWGKFSYYGLVGFLFFISVVPVAFHLIHYLQTGLMDNKGEEIWIIIIPALLGFLLYQLQKKRLRYRLIATTLSRNEIRKVVEGLADKLKMSSYMNGDTWLMVKTNPGFFSGSWGEQITFLFDADVVLINSICDPDRRSGVDITGRNNRNVSWIFDEIKQRDPYALIS